MKIENEKELFDLFVEKDNDLREKFKKPFVDGRDKRVWATDGHLLLMVNPDCVSGEYDVQHLNSGPNVTDYNCNYEIPVKELVDAIDRCQKAEQVMVSYNEKTCPECDGKGTVYADYHANYDNNYYDLEVDCPICEGSGVIDEEKETKTGKVMPQEDSVIKMGECYFFNKYIQRIVKACELLKVEKVVLKRTHRKTHSTIMLDEVFTSSSCHC